LIPFAFGKGHLARVEVEGGLEDMGRGELLPQEAAAWSRRGQGHNDLPTLTIGNRCGLLSGTNRFPIGGVEGCHVRSGSSTQPSPSDSGGLGLR
jgi:hypothetical protein